MVLHRSLDRSKRLCDLTIAIPAGDQSQYVELAFGETLRSVVRRVRLHFGSYAIQSAQHMLCDGRPDQVFPGRNAANPGRQQLERNILQQEAARTRLYAIDQGFIVVERCQQNGRWQLVAVPQLADDLDAALARHSYVEQHDIRMVLANCGDTFIGRADIGDNDHVFGQLQQ